MVVPRQKLVSRLCDRRDEIEHALLAHGASLLGSEAREDLEYRLGLPAAVSAAFDYCIAVIASSDCENPPPIPAAILAQARLAAHGSIAIDAEMRRCTASFQLLDTFILEEIEPTDWQQLHGSRIIALNLLLSEVSAEYKREHAKRTRSQDAVAVERVRKALKGEPVDWRRLDYNPDLHHVGIVAEGRDSVSLARRLAKALDGRLLLVRPGDELTWGWIGRGEEFDTSVLVTRLQSTWDSRTPLAVGEADVGPTGWRRTHRQARDVFIVAQKRPSAIARYRQDCLLASVLKDELLSPHLWGAFITPLLTLGERGSIYLRTLRAYFRADGNRACASATLGVSRQTVAAHLCAIEECLGTSLSGESVGIQLALRLLDAEYSGRGPAASNP